MKKIVFAVMLMFVALTATAQDKKGETLNEKYFDAKVSELVYRLDMTNEQKEKFIPIYRRYNDEMHSVMGPRMKKKGEWKKGDKDVEKKDGEAKQPKQKLTEEQKLARTKQRMEMQQKAQSIRLKYMDEFCKVLDAGQMNKFYEVENKIQKKLQARRMHPKGKKNGKKKCANSERNTDR